VFVVCITLLGAALSVARPDGRAGRMVLANTITARLYVSPRYLTLCAQARPIDARVPFATAKSLIIALLALATG